MTDWTLVFANAFRGENTQEAIKEIFGENEEVILTKERFEQIVVQVCTMIMREVIGDEHTDDTE